MENHHLLYFKSILEQQMEELLERACRTVSMAQSIENRFSDRLDMTDENVNSAFMFRIRDRENKLIKKIKLALDKIENGEYGCCDMCEEEISYARLKARPVANMCIHCKTLLENREKVSPSRTKHYNKIWETYVSR